LLSYRKTPPRFEWVRGHAGSEHNERADELAGLGAFGNDRSAYDRWQTSQQPEARNRTPGNATREQPERPPVPPAELTALRTQAEKLNALFDTLGVDRVGDQERKFINDMAKRLQKNNFVPSEKQKGWLKGLVVKYKV
jgi:hypothetical protein